MEPPPCLIPTSGSTPSAKTAVAEIPNRAATRINRTFFTESPNGPIGTRPSSIAQQLRNLTGLPFPQTILLKTKCLNRRGNVPSLVCAIFFSIARYDCLNCAKQTWELLELVQAGHKKAPVNFAWNGLGSQPESRRLTEFVSYRTIRTNPITVHCGPSGERAAEGCSRSRIVRTAAGIK